MLGDLDPIPLLCNQLEVSIPWMEVQILLHQLNKLDKKYIKCYDVILSIQFHMTNLEVEGPYTRVGPRIPKLKCA